MITIMGHSEEIDEAIAAHHRWKQRLYAAVTEGADLLRLAQVEGDHSCELGEWFYGLPAAVQESEQAQAIRQVHAAFHTEAARILILAMDEHVTEAEQALAPDRPYARVSEQLTSALTRWKAAIGG
jgi:methyl-accepting chemotaxis protein